MQNGFQNNGFQNDGFVNNGRGGVDMERFISDSNFRKINALVGIVKGAMMAGICGFAVLSPMFKAMINQGDRQLNLFGYGFVILLILMIVIGVLSAIRNLITLILMMTGNDTDGFGRKYIIVMGLIESNTGRMIQIVMGSIFVIFSVFAISSGADHLAEGSSIEGLYIVSGVFIAAGLGLAIAGVIGIIKSFRNYIVNGGTGF